MGIYACLCQVSQADNRCSVVVSLKVILYISSFFTSMLNDMLSVHPSKTLFSLHSNEMSLKL